MQTNISKEPLGYYSQPTIYRDQIVFVNEDDLWTVDKNGGLARRLTNAKANFSKPRLSPDGRHLSASSREEGSNEIVIFPAQGGEMRRLSYMGSAYLSSNVGWLGNEIIFTSGSKNPFWAAELYSQKLDLNSEAQALNLGPATSMSSGKNLIVIEHNSFRPDPAVWKRYRGGTAGKLLVAKSLKSEFECIRPLGNANCAFPLVIGARIFFVSDANGVAQLYSCKPDASDLKKHTNMKEFYVRNPQSDGRNIVFQAGAELFKFDLKTSKTSQIKISTPSQRAQSSRKWVGASENYESVNLHPSKPEVAVTFRGTTTLLPCFEGPAIPLNKDSAQRQRLGTYTGDGTSFVFVDDSHGEERLCFIPNLQHKDKFEYLKHLGRIMHLEPLPKLNQIIVGNHKGEYYFVDLVKKTSHCFERETKSVVGKVSMSPCGRYAAYSLAKNFGSSVIKIYDVKERKGHVVTKEFLRDYAPSFDPKGRYLYFISSRELNPVYDSTHFGMSFPSSSVPAFIILSKDCKNPLLHFSEKEVAKEDPKAKKIKTEIKTLIDFDGIENRLFHLPVDTQSKIFSKIVGISEHKVLFLSFEVKGELSDGNWMGIDKPKGCLQLFDFSTRKTETYGSGISGFDVWPDASALLIQCGKELYRVGIDESKFELKTCELNLHKKTGPIDLNRAQRLVDPKLEWRQMFAEMWRLQKENYWDENLGGVDWDAARKRYEPLVDRISTRSEFSDLAWELQGELGTSHAYEMGGDYRKTPSYSIGQLGADFKKTADGYRIEKIYQGDSWKTDSFSPLSQAGQNFNVGDEILAINGTSLKKNLLGEALFHLTNQDVEVIYKKAKSKKEEKTVLRTLSSESSLRYRDWVSSKIAYVSKKSQGKIGYIHIPDMVADGFQEFHRHFLRDFDCDGLIVDFRYNGGGHVSPLLIEKLARKRLGGGSTRHFGHYDYPEESPTGVMVGITNEFAGSDGDMGPHQFKMRGLGPLIGMRSWGGVVGIWPRHRLLDGALTTQPEFAHAFDDVGWDLENHGVDPDIEVPYLPHHYVSQVDPQLDRAIEVALEKLKVEKPKRFTPLARPNRTGVKK